MIKNNSKNTIFLLLFIVIFELAQKSIATTSPWTRLILIPLFGLIYLYHQQLDHFLTKSLQTPLNRKIILTLFILSVAIRSAVFVRKIYQPIKHQEDIARVYIKSVGLLFHQHKNPYKSTIDHYPLTINGKQVNFSGPKYPPLQIILYSPFVLLFGAHGIYLGNFVAYIAMLILVMYLLNKKSKYRAYLGGTLYLATDYFFTKAFMKGINDFIPTAFVLYSFYYFQKKASTNSGILLGLSAASKQLPAGIFLLLMVCYQQWKIVFYSIVTFVIITLPWLLSNAFYPFWHNVIIFNLLRPPRAGSFQFLLNSPWNQLLFISVLLLIITATIWSYNKHNHLLNLFSGYGHITIYLHLFLMAAKMSPAHYFVWGFPFFILWTLDSPQTLSSS